jgi:hypothetical protein
MQLVIHADGSVRCLYGEAIPLGELGDLTIRRGQWLADMSPVGGPTLGPFATRSEALAAEEAWLVENRLV